MASPQSSSARINRGFEENTLAILDSSGIKEPRDVLDDRLSFLDAVRSASLLSDAPTPPSKKIFNAVFQILRDSRSLELAMASHQLLTELEDRYPRVSVSGVGKLVVAKEAWLPFIVSSETVYGDGDGTLMNAHDLLDCMRFSQLIEDISHGTHKAEIHLVIKLVENMLLFQYLVNVLEKDFSSRCSVYKETLNWSFVRESILNLLLGPRKLNFKKLVRECMSIILTRSQNLTNFSLQDLKNAGDSPTKITQNSDVAVTIAMKELEKRTCSALQNLLMLIMELDALRKDADLQGLTSRSDGSRASILEIILDELTYNKDHISPFLEVISDPKLKLEVVLKYFSKYLGKSYVRTRRSADCSDDITFEGVLSLFSTSVGAKNVVKKITLEVALLLIVHAFQAYLSLLPRPEGISNCTEKIARSSLSQLCSSFILGFKNLRKLDGSIEATPFEKEALFTAAAILSNYS